MSSATAQEIADAILYEGYILYPYRSSSAKNQQRFTFGRVYPRPYSIAAGHAEPCVMQTECLLEASSSAPDLQVRVRFLHPVLREVCRLPQPLPQWKADAAEQAEPVVHMRVDEHIFQTWHEAVEVEVPVAMEVFAENERSADLTIARSITLEPIADQSGLIPGFFKRRREALEGKIRIKTTALDRNLFRITVRIENETAMSGSDLAQSDAVLRRTFASAHTILQANGAAFFSSLDPPARWTEAIARCRNMGTFPVLVGDEAARARDTMLSSPIILYDYPKIAKASAGDLFDGTEIDEILSLRIQTLTDSEKAEMRDVDAFARRLLQRTDALTPDQLFQMHGVMQPSNALEDQIFGGAIRREELSVAGIIVRKGDRVRLRPKARADVMDLALAGKIAIVEAIEEDAEARVYLAVVIEDDPGRDLGLCRQPGHRFFYGADEVEPLTERAV